MIALVPKAMLGNYLAVSEFLMLSRLRFCWWAVDLGTVGKELNMIVVSICTVILLQCNECWIFFLCGVCFLSLFLVL